MLSLSVCTGGRFEMTQTLAVCRLTFTASEAVTAVGGVSISSVCTHTEELEEISSFRVVFARVFCGPVHLDIIETKMFWNGL